MSKAPAVDYALRIIEYFAETQNEIGISDICNSLGINKNAASRVLESLAEYKWIYLSDESQKKYRFTLKPFSLVSKCTPQNALADIAENELKKLNKKLGDSVYLGIRNKKNVMYLTHFESLKEVRVNGRAGGEYTLHRTAPGKALLAFGGDKDIEEYFGKQKSEPFKKEAEEIRRCGYALDREEFASGIICVACPVFNEAGKAVASVGISSLTIYDTIESLVEKKMKFVREAAENISLKLGYTGKVQ